MGAAALAAWLGPLRRCCVLVAVMLLNMVASGQQPPGRRQVARELKVLRPSRRPVSNIRFIRQRFFRCTSRAAARTTSSRAARAQNAPMRVRIACCQAAPQCATAAIAVCVCGVYVSTACTTSARCSSRSRSTSASCTRASGFSRAPSSSSRSALYSPSTHPLSAMHLCPR